MVGDRVVGGVAVGVAVVGGSVGDRVAVNAEPPPGWVGAAVVVVGAAVVGAATSPLEAHPVRRATVSSQAGRRESTGSV